MSGSLLIPTGAAVIVMFFSHAFVLTAWKRQPNKTPGEEPYNFPPPTASFHAENEIGSPQSKTAVKQGL